MKNNRKAITYSLLGIFLFLGIMTIVTINKVINSQQYQVSKQFIQNEKKIVQEIGEPFEFGLIGISSETYHYRDSTGKCEMKIPVKGNQKDKKIFLKLKLKDKKWEVESYEIL